MLQTWLWRGGKPYFYFGLIINAVLMHFYRNRHQPACLWQEGTKMSSSSSTLPMAFPTFWFQIWMLQQRWLSFLAVGFWILSCFCFFQSSRCNHGPCMNDRAILSLFFVDVLLFIYLFISGHYAYSVSRPKYSPLSDLVCTALSQVGLYKKKWFVITERRPTGQTTGNIWAPKYYIFPVNNLPHRPP